MGLGEDRDPCNTHAPWRLSHMRYRLFCVIGGVPCVAVGRVFSFGEG